MADALPSPTPDGAAPSQRVAASVRDSLGRAYTQRSDAVLAASLTAGTLAFTTLAGAPSWPHALWLAALAALLVLRLLLVNRWRRLPALPPAVCLPRARALTIVHGAIWGALGWVGPAPQGADQIGVLVMLQGGVALGGMALLLFDRRAALVFVATVALPLLVRLLTLPGPLPLLVPVALAMLALLVLCLYAAASRGAREREQLAVARLAEADRREQAARTDALLRHVFDHVGEGICLFDPALRLLAVNHHMAELLGLDPALAVPGTPLREWVLQLARAGEYGPVDAEAEAARRIADVRRPTRNVAQRTRPNGRTIETRRTPLPDGGFAMVCVDVTDRLASEEALFENKRTLDVLLEKTEEGFWFIDNALCTTDANRAMCRMLGVTRQELLGRSIYDFVDAENEAIFRHQVALRAQGRAGSYEIALRRTDGTLVHCWNNATPIHDAQGRKIGAIGLFSDITAHRRTSALLAEQSQVLAMTLQSLSQGVLAIAPGGRLATWNDRARELLQVPEGMMASLPTLEALVRWQIEQGQFGPALELLPSEREREGVRQTLAGSDARRLVATEQYRRRRPDGRVLEVRLHRSPDGGEVRTYTDLTAVYEAEQALIAARDEAERANRAKSEFLSRMSHELRTPLNAILGFGQLLLHDGSDPLDSGQRARVEQILQGGQHLLALVNEVLDLARIEAGTLPLALQPVDAAALADECLQLVAPMARERGITLELPAGRAPAPRADPMRLRQVLLNLLSNAIKHGPAGGRVALRLLAVPFGARIEVHDEGPGLDDRQQQRLFQVFERLEADRLAVEGAGLGLALSRALIEGMQGRIGVRSAPGQGSCFWIELPAADAAPPAARRRVLYIEDNEVNRVLMQGMLAHRPELELQLAELPDEGLALARADPPALVLLDIQLPGMNGYEVLRALRTAPALAAVPVIAVSANAMPQDIDRARAAGFDDYLTKPLDLNRLLDAIDRVLAATASTTA